VRWFPDIPASKTAGEAEQAKRRERSIEKTRASREESEIKFDTVQIEHREREKGEGVSKVQSRVSFAVRSESLKMRPQRESQMSP